jgi:release factor glutamine methyltransferase
LLVEIAIERLEATRTARVVDVGTGTGAIAIAIATRAVDATIVAADASQPALCLARRNVAAQGVPVALIRADLMQGLGRFDVVVANLPYVSSAEWRSLPPEIRDFEPTPALVGGAKGTEVIERLLLMVAERLQPGGLLALEIGATQGRDLTQLAARSMPGAEIRLVQDLAGLDRVLVVRL